jgi:predicted GTPase
VAKVVAAEDQDHAASDRDKLASLTAALDREIAARPPAFGLVGVSGVGKSSTVNALFRTQLPTSDTVACTKEFRAVPLDVAYSGPAGSRQQVALTVIDAPGLGEDLARDPEYLEMYEQNLGRCDVVLWVMSARNRAVALDQLYLRQLSQLHGRIVLGISQADLVEPMDWVKKYNIPSAQQERNLRDIEVDRAAKIRTVVGRACPVVTYSARRGYQLEKLFTTLLKSCPEDRRWIYAGLKNFTYKDFLPADPAARLAARSGGFLGRIFNGQ